MSLNYEPRLSSSELSLVLQPEAQFCSFSLLNPSNLSLSKFEMSRYISKISNRTHNLMQIFIVKRPIALSFYVTLLYNDSNNILQIFNHISLVQFFILLSCAIAVSVNFSTFMVIGKTSPVTYQVLGHLKTCLVLAFGYILLKDPFRWRNICGIIVALVGMILYSFLCSSENKQKASDTSSQSLQVLFIKYSVCLIIYSLDMMFLFVWYLKN